MHECTVDWSLKPWEKATLLKATTTTHTVKIISVPPKRKRNDEGLLTVNTPICKWRSLEIKTIQIIELDSDEEEVIEEDSTNQSGNKLGFSQRPSEEPHAILHY